MLFDPEKMGGLTVNNIVPVIDYYEACATAEFILENYEPKPTEEEALRLGYLVRDSMRKNDVYDGDSEVFYINHYLQAEHLWRDK